MLAGQGQGHEAVHPAAIDLREHAEEMVHRVPRHIGVGWDVAGQRKRPVVEQCIGKTGELIGHRQIAIGRAGRVLLQPGKAPVDPSLMVEQARHRGAAGRLVRPEIMIEAAVLLKDHDDMVDLVAQPLEVRPGRRRRPRWRGKARGQQRRATGRRRRFEKVAPALPEDRHHAPLSPRSPRPTGSSGPQAANITPR